MLLLLMDCCVRVDDASPASPLLLLAVLAAGVAAAVVAARQMRREARDAVDGGRVAALFIYPVKACRGVAVDSADCGEAGLRHDRVFAVVDGGGQVVTLRQRPELVAVEPQLRGDDLVLAAPGMPALVLSGALDGARFGRGEATVPVRVWRTSCAAVDCGADVASWWQGFLGAGGYRMVRVAPGCSRLCADDTKWGAHARRGERAAFADFSPVMAMFEASVADMAARLAVADGTSMIRRFRPNIVLSGAAAPYAEDGALELALGHVRLRVIKPCHRCVVTTIDPETGVRDAAGEPLRTLRTYRSAQHLGLTLPAYGTSPLMGLNCGVVQPGALSVGDPVRLRCR